MGFEDSGFDPQKDEYLEGGGFVKKEAAALERTAKDFERITGFRNKEFLEILAREEDTKRAWDALTEDEKLQLSSEKLRGLIKEDLTTLLNNQGEIDKILEENPEFRDDKELMLRLVISGYSQGTRRASERLQNDKDYALGAVQRNGMALSYLPETMQDDEDVVMTAVKTRGLALREASPRLRNKREIVVAAITSGNDFDDIKFASDEVIEGLLDENNPANKDILHEALHNEHSNENYARIASYNPHMKGVHQYDDIFKKYEHLHMREKIEKILGEKL